MNAADVPLEVMRMAARGLKLAETVASPIVCYRPLERRGTVPVRGKG